MGLVITGADVLVGGSLERVPVRLEGSEVAGFEGPQRGDRVVDAPGAVVAPAFTDLHAHLRWPGGEVADEPEDLAVQALVGGFATVVAMANTTPAIDRVERWLAARDRFGGLPIEVVQAASATMERAGERPVDVEGLARAGVRIISDDGDPVWRADVLLGVLEAAADAGVVVAQHATIPELSHGVMNASVLADRLGYDGIPEVAEVALVARDVALVRQTGARYHLQHLSARESVNVVRAAQREGLAVTAEVTPHHLGLEESELLSHDARFRVNPPLRSRATRMALVEALLGGAVDAVATDHAPHPERRKAVPLALAAPGMLGLVEAFPATWTAVLEQLELRGSIECARPQSLDELGEASRQALVRVLEAFAVGSARVLGRRREVQRGQLADLVVVDPCGRTMGGGEGLYRSANSPWASRELIGSIRWVVRGGRVVVEEGRYVGA